MATQLVKLESALKYHIGFHSKTMLLWMIQRDDMGWKVGGGFMFGNSCTLVADSCQCMATPIRYCKVK